jgi:hypothetical protein
MTINEGTAYLGATANSPAPFPKGLQFSTAEGSNASIIINQTHGWTVGNWYAVYWSATDILAKAQANSTTTSDVVGIAYVRDASNLLLVTNGVVNHSNLASINNGTALAANTAYYLSAATAGLITSTPPVAIGNVQVQICSGKGLTSANVVVKTGILVATLATPFYEEGSFVANFNTGMKTGTNNITVLYKRVGKVVTLTLPATTVATAGATANSWGTGSADVPASIRPVGTVYFAAPIRINTGVDSILSNFRIFSSGLLYFSHNGSGTWTIGETLVGFPDCSFTYTI